MKVFLVIGGSVFFVLALLFAIGSRESDVPVSERIKRECEKLHSHDEYQSNNCRIALSLRYIDDANKSKMNRAYERIR